MDLRFLDTFLEVATTRHFGKAAENLYLTQSAVSARIKSLEEHFNVALFVRNRNSILLTSAGEKLIPFAESMSESMNQARKSLSENDMASLVCAATPNASELALHDFITQVKSGFATVSIRAEILNTDQLSRQLHERIVDIALTTDPIKSDDVENILIMSSPVSIYALNNINEDDVFSNYLHLDWGHKISEKVHQCYPQTKKARFKTSAISIASNALNHGFTSVLMTKQMLKSDATKNYVLFDNMEGVDLHIYLVYLKDNKNTVIADLIRFCQANLIK